MNLISVAIPCFNEEKSIPHFYEEFMKVYEDSLNYLEYELIFINDGSVDNTLLEIKKLAKKDSNVKYVSFSRNFGKESALYAGLKYSAGDYVVVMDVDLQDPPNLLPQMVEIINEGVYDVVGTRRVSRKGEPLIRSFFARMFYKIINNFSNLELVDGARDYRLMKRQVIDAILDLREYNRFSKGLFVWVGFETKWIEYENIERIDGESSWSFWALLKYSIEGIVAFSTVPLYLATIMGVIFSLVAFVMIFIIIIKNLFLGELVQGWTSTICVILLLGGIQLLSMGILGQYLEKTYIETKKRPLYIIKDKNF